MTLTNNELYSINGGCFIIVFSRMAKFAKAVVRLFFR